MIKKLLIILFVIAVIITLTLPFGVLTTVQP